MAAQMLHICVNVVGEHGALDEELAAPYKQEFEDISDVLEQAGLPRFEEPQDIIPWDEADDKRKYHERIPVRCLHLLRRAYAAMKVAQKDRKTSEAAKLPSADKSSEEEAQSALDAEVEKGTSHLCCHSDTAGTYLPMEQLEQPLIAVKACPWRPIPGGIVGSTSKLLDELIEVAPSLGIKLQPNESLSEAEAARVYSIASTQGAEREGELKAWLALHEAAELSLSYGTAIFFD